MYYAVSVVVLLGVLYVGYQSFFNTAPTCRDGIENQNERGVDCGGACARICTQDAREPVVLWSRTFKTSPGRYTAAAYIQNNNSGAGARRAGYIFKLYDQDGVLIKEREGVIDLPPSVLVPIVETNIDTGTRDAVRAEFAFVQTPTWQKITTPLPQLRTTEQALSQDGSRLTATLVNDSSLGASRTTVVAVLYNRAGVALAASKSSVSVPAKSSEFVVFTWQPAPLGVYKAEISVLPPF